MRLPLPMLLSVNGGYVDTAGFLALQGLFTSHVTGNFVTLGAALVLGTSGVVAKLLALPLFCLVVFTTRWLSLGLTRVDLPALRTLLSLQVLLLLVGAYLAIHLGPFHSGDGWQALLTGMTLVAAMAIQNAIHRIHMANTLPTTIMTGNTTQVMIDLADSLRRLSPEARSTLHARLGRMSSSIAAFAIGCGVAALIYALRGDWCFLIPPLIAVVTLLLPESAPPPKSPQPA